MNRRCLLLAGALAASLATGCATSAKPPAVDIDDKVTVTGSRIPRSDPNSVPVRATSDQSDIKGMVSRPSATVGGGN